MSERRRLMEPDPDRVEMTNWQCVVYTLRGLAAAGVAIAIALTVLGAHP